MKLCLCVKEPVKCREAWHVTHTVWLRKLCVNRKLWRNETVSKIGYEGKRKREINQRRRRINLKRREEREKALCLFNEAISIQRSWRNHSFKKKKICSLMWQRKKLWPSAKKGQACRKWTLHNQRRNATMQDSSENENKQLFEKRSWRNLMCNGNEEMKIESNEEENENIWRRNRRENKWNQSNVCEISINAGVNSGEGWKWHASCLSK